MKFIETGLEKLAHLQIKKRRYFILFGIIVTLFFLIAIPRIQMQTDMMQGMPQDLPIFKLNDRVTDTFGGSDVVVVITQIDASKDNPNGIKDIRDPRTIAFMQELEAKLSEESSINAVMSLNSYLQGQKIQSKEQLEYFLDLVPDAKSFFSDDYTATIMYITADVGSSQEKIDELVQTIDDNLDAVSKVPGTKNYVTGEPNLMSTISKLMGVDALTTILVALAGIFILLIILKKSLLKATVILTPLVMGLIWTIGFLSYLGIQITVATAGLGAMLLGLGVEYSVFVLTRYLEERDKGYGQDKALSIAVPAVGQAITGSGLTTLMGFLALTLSSIPMIEDLGKTLAIGIGSILVAAVIIAPPIFTLIEEKHLISIKKKRKNIFTNH